MNPSESIFWWLTLTLQWIHLNLSSDAIQLTWVKYFSPCIDTPNIALGSSPCIDTPNIALGSSPCIDTPNIALGSHKYSVILKG